jgi:hypothetical protein
MEEGRRVSIVLLAVLILVLAVPAVGMAQSGTDKGIAHIDQQPFSNIQWDVSARSNFNGTQPRGQWRFTNPNFDPNFVASGEVTCLQVVNNVALVGGIITDLKGSNTTANAVWMAMTDSGKFGTTPDLFGAFLLTLPPEDLGTCPPTNTVFQNTVVDGEVIVEDALN